MQLFEQIPNIFKFFKTNLNPMIINIVPHHMLAIQLATQSIPIDYQMQGTVFHPGLFNLRSKQFPPSLLGYSLLCILPVYERALKE